MNLQLLGPLRMKLDRLEERLMSEHFDPIDHDKMEAEIYKLKKELEQLEAIQVRELRSTV